MDRRNMLMGMAAVAASGTALSACQPHDGGKAAPPQSLSESVPINPPSPDYFIPDRFKGKTILVSSHILVETETLADSVLIIARGRIVASGTLREIRAMLEDRPLTVEIVSDDARRLASLLVNEPDVRGIELRSDSLVVKTRNPQRFFGLINDLIAENGVSVRKLQSLDAGADAVFNYLQQGAR